MSVLTNTMAPQRAGRPDAYRFTRRVDAASVYLTATSGYARRFEGLSGDSLRQLEIRTRNTDEPRDLVEELHGLLNGPWKCAIDRFEATVTDADYQAVAGLPADHPRVVAYRAASSAMDTWLAARETLHTAWMDWSLDLTGTVPIEDPPAPEPVTVEGGHRVPECDGWCGRGEACSTEIGTIPIDGNGRLAVEIYSYEGEPTKGVIFNVDAASDGTLLRTGDPAELRRTADEFHAFASRINHAAAVIEQLHAQEAK